MNEKKLCQGETQYVDIAGFPSCILVALVFSLLFSQKLVAIIRG